MINDVMRVDTWSNCDISRIAHRVPTKVFLTRQNGHSLAGPNTANIPGTARTKAVIVRSVVRETGDSEGWRAIAQTLVQIQNDVCWRRGPLVSASSLESVQAPSL